jgi:hypothetical protein
MVKTITAITHAAVTLSSRVIGRLSVESGQHSDCEHR